MDLVIVRFLSKNAVELMKREKLPADAVATGRIVPDYPEYLVGTEAERTAFLTIINKISK